MHKIKIRPHGRIFIPTVNLFSLRREPMATITKQGKGYKITVSCGYDIKGRQLRQHTIWIPPVGITEKQLQKELNRHAVLFEEKVKMTSGPDGNIRLIDFTHIFIEKYARSALKAKTLFGYEQSLAVINQALGHIRLKDLKPGHIASFYGNLQEAGVRARTLSKCKIDFSLWLQSNKITMVSMAEKTGLSISVFKKLKKGEPILEVCAKNIAATMGCKYEEVFDCQRDMAPLSPGTIHTYHRILSAVLFRAVKWGYIPSNPASRADLPSLSNRKAKYLDEPDAHRLLELLHDEPIKWRTIITFDLLSGLRRGELAGLRWEDVDFDNHTIMISQTSNYVPGRGVYIDTPKTTTSKRPLRLSQTAFSLLSEYRR